MSHVKKKILVLTSTYPRWQGDHEPGFVHELCKRCTKDFEVHVLAPHAADCLVDEVIDNVNIHRYRYFPGVFETLCYEGGIISNLSQNPLRILLVPFFLLSQFLSARRLIASRSIDVVHAHWIIPQGLVAALLKILSKGNIKILMTSHGADLYSLDAGFLNWFKKISLNKADRITVVSNAMKEYIHRYNQNLDVDVIPMGTDLIRRFVPGDRAIAEYDFIFVGRLVEKKGVTILLQAFRKVCDQFPESSLCIIGSGPLEADLKNQSDELNLVSNVTFCGAVENRELPRYFQRSNIAVFPFIKTASGDQEGFGLVMIEAAGCGCAVIASNLPAIKDVLGNADRGVIVEPENPDDLADAMVKLLLDKDACIELSSKARAFALENFDWEVISSKYKALLGGV
jgi:glycosyltransferase involved in cell wall biosynthesis